MGGVATGESTGLPASLDELVALRVIGTTARPNADLAA
jgi:hypothetical protein